MSSVAKINVLTVPEPMKDELERRFAGRAGAVESADGFEGFELLRPVDGTDRYLVYTRWSSEEAYQAWAESQSFRQGHAKSAGPSGPASSASELWSFDVIESVRP